MAHHLTDKMLNRILRDAQKLNDPKYLKKSSKPQEGKLCMNCRHVDKCGEPTHVDPSKKINHKKHVRCEMYKPKPGSKPKQNNRKLFDGRK